MTAMDCPLCQHPTTLPAKPDGVRCPRCSSPLVAARAKQRGSGRPQSHLGDLTREQIAALAPEGLPPAAVAVATLLDLEWRDAFVDVVGEVARNGLIVEDSLRILVGPRHFRRGVDAALAVRAIAETSFDGVRAYCPGSLISGTENQG